MILRPPLMAGLAAAAFIAAAAGAQADDGYLLRRTPRAGEVDRYQIALNVNGKGPNGDPLNIEITMVTADVVKKVDTDGSYLVATTVESGSGKVNGQDFKIPTDGQAFVTQFDKSGKVLKRDSGGGQAGNMAQILAMTRMGWAPERRVKAGENVKYDIPLGDEQNPRKLTGVISVMGIEKASPDLPIDALKIRNVGDMALPGAESADKKLHLEVTTFLRPDDARPMRTDGALTNVHFGPLSGAKITFKVNRIDTGSGGK